MIKKRVLLAFMVACSANLWAQNTAETSVTTLGSTTTTETTFVDVIPQPKPGAPSIHNYIAANFNYPPVALEAEIEGTIIVEFDVNTQGEIININVIQGLCPSCDKEAIRVIHSYKYYQPALRDGVPVKSRMRIPVRLQLS